MNFLKCTEKTYQRTMGYTIKKRIRFTPIWVDFLHGVNEGGGQYFIFESTPNEAWDKYREVTRIKKLNS